MAPPDEFGNMTPEESYAAALAEPPTVAEQEQSGEPITPAEPAEPEANPDASGSEEPKPKGHPAWDEMWKDVPDPIREAQRPFLEKMDRDYQHLLAKHNPYKEFEENGVDPEYIKAALGVQQAILNDPADFYNRLGEAYGLTAAQTKQLKADDPLALAEDDDDDWEDPKAKALSERLRALEERDQQNLTAQQQWEQEQLQAQEEERQTQQIESKLDEIKSQYGDFDREEVVLRAIANLQAGKNPSLENAYFEIKAYEDKVAARVVKNAPKVLGAGAGSGPAIGSTQPERKGPPTADELYQMALAEGKRVAESFNQ